VFPLKITIIKAGDTSELELPENSTVKSLLDKINLKDSLVVRNGEILTDSDVLLENDRLRFVPIVSGG